MNENIFNLENTEDIPLDVLKNLRIIRCREDTGLLLSLFDKKKRLTIDEILVGLYRLNKMQKTRVWVSSTLYNLSRKNLIRKVKDSKYEYEK